MKASRTAAIFCCWLRGSREAASNSWTHPAGWASLPFLFEPEAFTANVDDGGGRYSLMY